MLEYVATCRNGPRTRRMHFESEGRFLHCCNWNESFECIQKCVKKYAHSLLTLGDPVKIR